MCLAIPGVILDLQQPENDPDGLFRSGRVEFEGTVRQVGLALVPEAGVGDWVIVHAGVAIACLQEDEALQTLADVRQLQALEEG